MTTFEERQELMRMAGALQHELNSVAKRVHLLICKIIGEADAMMLKAFDEQATEPKVQKIRFSTPTGRTDTTQPNITPLPQEAIVFPEKQPGKRGCGLCGQPGHRRGSCPNAHKLQAIKKAEVALRDLKKDRAAALKPGQRACSVCRMPGHRAGNCPEAK